MRSVCPAPSLYDADVDEDGLRKAWETGVPSPCPACGAGPEQSSDPGSMGTSVCYCGHPRYYDYKHLDGSCPCAAERPT
ncbi:hypothetical protein GCM10023191_079930 [Actinoallomurus oryzae]|uniref:Uncharacterized protein n=1 Tax=Actinoallomurus oryzae TaxID=502180 RepID=A0ABP8QYD5_9ACTN